MKTSFFRAAFGNSKSDFSFEMNANKSEMRRLKRDFGNGVLATLPTLIHSLTRYVNMAGYENEPWPANEKKCPCERPDCPMNEPDQPAPMPDCPMNEPDQPAPMPDCPMSEPDQPAPMPEPNSDKSPAKSSRPAKR